MIRKTERVSKKVIEEVLKWMEGAKEKVRKKKGQTNGSITKA